MVYRIYVEKKPGQDNEAGALFNDIRSYLGIKGVTKVRLLNRYDAEGLSPELFDYSCTSVFSEPAIDYTYKTLNVDTPYAFAVEYLPGQFDQRADSAAQCIQIISAGERPIVKTAKVYLIYGSLTESELAAVKKHVINPVEAREADMAEKATLSESFNLPDSVPTLTGFTGLSKEGLASFISEYGLAMDIDDIAFLQQYFVSEHRDPTLTEVKVLDTYWSDHCRHTTFLTSIDNIDISDPEIRDSYNDYLKIRNELGRSEKPVTLMDLATIGCRYLKAKGKLPRLDESEEINACTVKISVKADGKDEDWLLLFKNETHNHPTEIEPFGGAATCIGGAIRDPLSGRSYVYAAMRVTGAADPTKPLSETIPGKLPQRKLTTTAAAGYSSYGNQIGLATGIVDELYHPGYAAKRMEIGAVIAATPAENVRRERPEAGDIVILLGGRTGRDGCGGATGSSKSHTSESINKCGAEVQKGNAPEERKLQRLFRNEKASRLIKRCNDFGAGGVSVAIGELSEGLDINLDLVPKKYAGLDGTELAISESQERMAVVIEPADKDEFLSYCAEENLEATVVATVSGSGRLKMTWNGKTIVDISREFLDSNGACKHADISVAAPGSTKASSDRFGRDFSEQYLNLAGDLNICSKQGLSERFDSTIGAGTVLMPFGGKNQLTPIQAMVHLISSEKKHTDSCSLMSWGFNPYLMESSPFHGSYMAVVESVSKLIASGAEFKDIYLTFQEYFEKPIGSPERFGKPFAALLGAMKAQLDLGIASIGGKDSMSGSFEKLDVPPTLCSFAVTTSRVDRIISPEFKAAGHKVFLFTPEYKNNLPDAASLLAEYNALGRLGSEKKLLALYTPGFGGIAEAVMKMCFGNSIGFSYDNGIGAGELFGYSYGSFVAEVSEAVDLLSLAGEGYKVKLLGTTVSEQTLSYKASSVTLPALLNNYLSKLEPVFATNDAETAKPVNYENISSKAFTPHVYTGKALRPKVLIPVFPGTNCEYDSAKAVRDAGADAEIFVIKNLYPGDVEASAKSFSEKISRSQIIFIPGGFSGADEPDGSAKLITAFFRNAMVKEAVEKLLSERDGLMCGICNGFQALIKLGLLPYGSICDQREDSPTLTFNSIGRHQSRLVRTRICSNLSPWLMNVNVGDIITVPISHGEGRFMADEESIRNLIKNGQVATQYVDLSGNASSDIRFNPNNSAMAIEGITSPDGRIIGKMGHSERIAAGLYRNVIGEYDIKMFKSAVEYFG